MAESAILQALAAAAAVYADATLAALKKSAGIGRCSFHVNAMGRSPLCDT